MELKNKTILIISPQAWGGLYVSKHHYAIELANRGNQVFFLYRGNKLDGSIEKKSSNIQNLHLLIFNEIISHSIRFHFRVLYDFMQEKVIVKKIINQIGKKIDIVWSFDLFLFKNLRCFNASLNIYHPVDKVKTKEQYSMAETSDIIFSVADNILEQFSSIEIPKVYINHGLAPYFYPSCQINGDSKSQNKRLRFAYIGNLTMPIIDHISIVRVIEENPKIDFYFYGKYKSAKETIEVKRFLSFLNQSDNVVLKGMHHPADLGNELKEFDGFLICYKTILDQNKGSNSHKMLEYLSFGKLIVSSYIKSYEKNSDIIQMSKRFDNSDYVELFNESIAQISQHNDTERGYKRQLLAYNNSYSKHLDTIESYLKEY